MSKKFSQKFNWPLFLGLVILVLALLLVSSPAPNTAKAAPERAPDALSISGIVNTYAPVTNISGSTVTIGTTTGSATPFAVNDWVILIQMTGAPPPHGGGLGVYEMKQITGVSGSNITLASVDNTYEHATQAVQLVRVPSDTTVTVTAAVNALDWNGTTGGIVALKGDTLTMNADIDASGSGFVAGTNTNAPWSGYDVVITFTPGLHADSAARTSLSSGVGSTNGRGNDGDGASGGQGGGGLGGGGGVAPGVGKGDGGGEGGGGKDATNTLAVGLAGGIGNRLTNDGGNGGGGGGGIIGGGGGGAAGANTGGGGGGGVAGGGSGGVKDGSRDGGGGGGYGASGTGANASCIDSCGAAGGGSYGGGGGSAASEFGGDDGGGGGGGGSWTGGGPGGVKGGSAGKDGGDGNNPVSSAISDSAHYLNNTNPRLLLGESGGSSTCADGGVGGGIIILDFDTVTGNGNAVKSDGQPAETTPTTCDPLKLIADGVDGVAYGAGGAGGGAAGQMRLTVQTWTSTSVSAAGGNGGDGNSNGEYHGGVSGGGAGGGGIWFDGVSSFTGGNTNTGGGNPVIPGITSWEIGGGSAGASTNNPKNDLATATSGSGGNGLVVVSLAADWGDLPDSFDTTTANSGPNHTITSDLYLGSCVDAETDGQPDAQAGNAGGGSGNGDDGNAGSATGSCTNDDDEDGVTLVTPLIPGAQACVSIDAVNSGATATLYGWIDFNGDGDFDGDANEKLTFTSGGTVSGSVTDQQACFTVPAAATFDGGETHMRFRLTRDTLTGGTPWNGSANDGEVEDYWNQLACVGNYLWIDTGSVANVQDATDTPVTDGTAVNLVWGGPDGVIGTGGDDVTYSTTTTGGLYNFCGLTADPNGNGNATDDNYQIVVPTLPGTPVTPNDTDDVHDSDCSVTGEMPTFMLPDPPNSLPTGENGNGDNPGGWGYPDNQDDQTLDCGFQPEVFSLGDLVWYDQDQDGIQDSGEPGYPGVQVELHDNATCTSGTGQFDTTDTSGIYGFSGLVAGTYSVQFTVPGGYTVSPQEVGGGTEATDSDADVNGCIPNITLGPDDPDEDMGIYVTGSIGDTVWCESTTNPNTTFDPGDGDTGTNDVTVTLYEDFDCNNTADGTAIGTMSTANGGTPAQDGYYLFTGLEVAMAGDPNNETCYVVEVDANDADLGSCNNPITVTEYNPELDSDNPDDPDNDFGFEEEDVYDYGDAPDNITTATYPNQTVNPNGARHLLNSELVLGTCVDSEANGVPVVPPAPSDSGSGNSDDSANGTASPYLPSPAACDQVDDEDGYLGVIDQDWSDGEGSLSVNVSGVSGSACVYGWIDFDQDGFDIGDATAQLAYTVDGTQTLVFGSNVPVGNIPTGVPIYVRLRVVPGACGTLAPTGEAIGGEVEDHHITSNSPTAIDLSQVTTTLPSTNLVWIIVATLVLLTVIVVRLRRRHYDLD